MYQVIQAAAVIISVYYVLLCISGLFYKDHHKEHLPQKYFAVIIPAHNEEKVIGNLITSLKSTNYPKHLYDIFVVADHCCDNTAAIAKANGATVYERHNASKKGKSYALEYIFDKIFAKKKKYDAVAILDADNIVSRDFLIHMNTALCEGKKVIQGRIESKNPFDSWITCAYSINFWSLSYFYQLPKQYLGLSCNLWGTGFVVDTQVLRQVGWDVHCLAEDLAFTFKLKLNHYKVSWAHQAVVYDEKPLTLSQSWYQRKRWIQGHGEVMAGYVPKLLRKVIREQDLSALDYILYMFQPIRLIAAGIVLFMAWAQTCSLNDTISYLQINYLFDTPYIWYFLSFMQFVFPPFVILIKQKFNPKVIKGYLTYPIFALTYALIAFQGIMDRNNKEWIHTTHSRNIGLEELEAFK